MLDEKVRISGISTRPISAACFPLAKWTEVAVVPSLPGMLLPEKRGKKKGEASYHPHAPMNALASDALALRPRVGVKTRRPRGLTVAAAAPSMSVKDLAKPVLSSHRRGASPMQIAEISGGGGRHAAAVDTVQPGKGTVGLPTRAELANARFMSAVGFLIGGRGAVLRVHLGVGGAHQQELLRSCQKSVYQRRTVTRRKQVVMSVKKAVFRKHHLHSPSKQSSSSSRES